MAPPSTIFIIGSGPMIGSHVARLFAEHGFEHLALFSRSISNLSRDASFVSSAVPAASVHIYEADVTDHSSLSSALEKAISEIGVPEVVLYNAARVNFSTFGQYSSKDIVEDFKIPNLGLYTTASKLLPHLQALAKTHPEAHPALFVTSGAIVHQPVASFFSLSMAKAAQANMTKLLAEENKDVVHVALVTVAGIVSMEEKVSNPPNVASKFWKLYEQEKGSWEFEMKCGW